MPLPLLPKCWHCKSMLLTISWHLNTLQDITKMTEVYLLSAWACQSSGYHQGKRESLPTILESAHSHEINLRVFPEGREWYQKKTIEHVKQKSGNMAGLPLRPTWSEHCVPLLDYPLFRRTQIHVITAPRIHVISASQNPSELYMESVAMLRYFNMSSVSNMNCGSRHMWLSAYCQSPPYSLLL